MNGLDALATAIMWYEGPFRPRNLNFRNMNPGNLRTPGWTQHDAGGYDIYPDFITGYTKLLGDLQAKFQAGKNSHGLTQSSTLAQLFKVYAPAQDSNDPASYAAFAAGWCSNALNKMITVSSLLSEIWTAPA